MPSPTGTQAVDRAAQLLIAVARHRDPVSFTELTAASGLAKSTTSRLLMALGDLVVGWLLARQAEVALARLDEGPQPADRSFYAGKVAGAAFFAATVLPRLSAEREIAETTSLDLMELSEDSF